MHKEIYRLGNTIPKRDKFGIHLKIETTVLDAFTLAIKAAYQPKQEKLTTLERLRLKLEVSKQLIRTAYELHIFDEKAYIGSQERLQEISKMTNGWMRYLTTE